MLETSFEYFSFRRWFNQRFSLSFDGKFKGLSTLVRLYGMRFVEHIFIKLSRMYRVKYHSRIMFSDIVVLKIQGHTLKLYNR